MTQGASKPTFSVTEVLSNRLKSRLGGVSTPSMQYGTLLHAAIEYYLTNLSVLNVEEELRSLGRNPLEFHQELLHCINLLARLFGADIVGKAKIILERRYFKELDKYIISGKPDFVLEHNGFKCVVDFKTDANIFKSAQKYKMQLSAYNMLVGGSCGVIINTKYFNFIQTTGLELKINENKFLQKADEFYLKTR